MENSDIGIRMEDACVLLWRLGITANYIGFFHTAYALSLCVERRERLLLATKWLYPEVAKRYDTTWKAVERNIRLTVCKAWKNNRPLLEQMACRSLPHRPSATGFLAMSAQYLSHGALCGKGRGQT